MAGFYGKFVIIMGAMSIYDYFSSLTILLVSGVAAVYYLRLIVRMYFVPARYQQYIVNPSFYSFNYVYWRINNSVVLCLG